MHLVGWNPDHEGEPVLRFAWLPYWLGANAKLRLKIQVALSQVIPPGTTVKDVTSSLWDMMDDAIINTICTEYPKIYGLEEFLRGLLKVSYGGRDPSAAKGV
jgi:hypothetical protein